ncbi:uncharacterized protein RAG0_03704 [Rhynchosporium agropyri]|uniref:Alpha-type protein kinase domain-containing protein n=1 Tax=Rhynchosporium agropyri TaxID=914238 RepID=A0A1E1K9S5_9HELO|nr:uncharacterized protein RAG0_03704 [Rhynchosporium agropyri]
MNSTQSLIMLRTILGTITSTFARQLVTHFCRLSAGISTVLSREMIFKFRGNDSTEAEIEMDTIFHSGSFMNVWEEIYTAGDRWTPMAGNASGDVMQALSHFSYHVSYGQLLLCDLQGGVYQNGFILSDPVIISPTQNYGPLDLGIDGINSFFFRHRCGFFCDKQWTKSPSTGPAVSYAEPSSDFSLACSESQGSAALETARMGYAAGGT